MIVNKQLQQFFYLTLYLQYSQSILFQDLQNINNLSFMGASYPRPEQQQLSDNQQQSIMVHQLNPDQEISQSNQGKTSIDLSSLSFIDAKQIDISLNNIQSIDLQANTELTKLNVSCNRIKSIDCRQNHELTHLKAGANKLTSINIQNNKKLRQLYLRHNQLKAIKLRNNTNLIKLQLSNNHLQQIDLSKNTSLRQLDLSDNQLVLIDLKQNTKLKTLYLMDNNLKSLDISHNKKLIYMNIRKNELESIILPRKVEWDELNVEQNRLSRLQIYYSPTLQEWLFLNLQRSESLEVVLIHFNKDSQQVNSLKQRLNQKYRSKDNKCKYIFETGLIKQ